MQERLFFELQKKRDKAIDRFSHNAAEMLDLTRVVLSGKKLQTNDINTELCDYVNKDANVWVISANSKYDKKIMTLNKSILLFFEDYLPIIITDGEHFALVKEEFSDASTQKYVLIKK